MVGKLLLKPQAHYGSPFHRLQAKKPARVKRLYNHARKQVGGVANAQANGKSPTNAS
jgi:hypothetical protein